MTETRAVYQAGQPEAAITFDAIVEKVQTLVDMGLRVTLDLPEDAVTQAAQLMELRRIGSSITVSVFVKQRITELDEKRSNKQSRRTSGKIAGAD